MALRVFVLPVSGQLFASQIGALQTLIAASAAAGVPAAPDIAIGSSGGCVTAFVGLAGGWTLPGVRRVTRALSPSLFAVPWVPGSGPVAGAANTLVGVFRGVLYARAPGDPATAFFESILAPDAPARSPEIWIGTMDDGRGRPQIFCSRAERDSLLAAAGAGRGVARLEQLLGCLPHVFLDGDIARCARACLASASIPAFVPPVEIDGAHYSDGGGSANNPLVYLRERVAAAAAGRRLELTLFSASDIDADNGDGAAVAPRGGIYAAGATALERLMRSLALAARASALDLLGPGARLEEGDADTPAVAALLARRENYTRSLLELVPPPGNSVSLVHFTQDDLERAIATSRAQLRYRFWYVE